MATAIADCAAARQTYAEKHGVAPIIIADGGMSVGGDICKAIACGADAAMIGSPFSRAQEAPDVASTGNATPSPVLPRGTRIKVRHVSKFGGDFDRTGSHRRRLTKSC